MPTGVRQGAILSRTQVVQVESETMREEKYRDWSPLLGAFLAGDPTAVVELTVVVHGLLARMRAFDVRPSWDDLCHEVLAAFLVSLRRGGLDQHEATIPYLETITRRKLSDWVRTQRRSLTPAFGSAALERLADRLSDDGAERDLAVLVDLERTLDELPEREAEVVRAVCIAGMSYQEAARELGLALGTLKQLRKQALSSIRERLGVRP